MADNDYEIMQKTLDLLGIEYYLSFAEDGKGFVLKGRTGNRILLWFTKNGMFKEVR